MNDTLMGAALYNVFLPVLWLLALTTGKITVVSTYMLIPLGCIGVLHLWAACKSVSNHKFNKYAFISLLLWVPLTWVNGYSDRIEVTLIHTFWTFFNFLNAKYFWRMWKNKDAWEKVKVD